MDRRIDPVASRVAPPNHVLMGIDEFSPTEETNYSSEKDEHDPKNGNTELFDEFRKRCHLEAALGRHTDAAAPTDGTAVP